MRKVSTMKIGKNLKQIRTSNGYTQEMLAERIEVSVRYVSDIEQDRSKPSYDVLVRICNLFKISIDDIFSEYLDLKNYKKVDYAMNGYANLTDEDKKTIEQLVMYFNKKNA